MILLTTHQHITSYPVVADSIKYYEENPYGAKSIALVNEAYQRFFVPVEPYFRTPYSYVAPYLAKADQYGDEGLKRVDAQFPVVKEETAQLKEKAQGMAGMPIQLGQQSKDYLFKVYQQELQKSGDGPLAILKAIITTELKVTADVVAMVAEVLSQKKQEAKKTAEKAEKEISN